MVSDDEQPIESSQPAASPQTPGGGRRRRGRRGGRGRGRGSRPSGQAQTVQVEQPAGPPAEGAPARGPEAPVASHRERDSSTISRAIEEAQQIVQSLEQVLEQMEEVRELIELADRQKSADEREIESLRRALRRIQRPPGERHESPVQNSPAQGE